VVAIGNTMTLDTGVLFFNVDDRLWLFVARQELEAPLVLASLRAIRKFDMPVDRMERVASMPCNNTSLPFMLTLDSNKNSPSNHPSKQSFTLLSL